MGGQVLTWLIVTWGAIGALIIIGQLLGAFSFDFMQIRAQRRFQNYTPSWRFRRQPFISVIVPTHNDEAVITDCLEHALRSNYSKFEVIVVDQASCDATKQLVRGQQKLYERARFRLIARRSSASCAAGLLYAWRQSQGDLVMVLHPADRLSPDALANAAWHWSAFPGAQAWLPRQAFSRPETLGGLFQQYVQLLRLRSLKLRSAWHLSPPATKTILTRRPALATVLRSSKNAAKDLLRLDGLAWGYAWDVVITRPAPSAFWRWFAGGARHAWPYRRLNGSYAALSWGVALLDSVRRLVALAIAAFALTAPVVVTYFIYLAIHLHEPTFLLVIWGALIAVLVSATWSDERLKLRQKLAYLLGMPLSFLFFYLASFRPAFLVGNWWLSHTQRR